MNSENDSRPTLEVTGNQGVRITFHSRSGDVIDDLETVAGREPVQIEVPARTGYITTWGLGGAGQIPDSLTPTSGGLTSVSSTHNHTGVGFQPDTNLVQLSPVTYICRGATIRAELIREGNPQSPDNHSFPAREVLKGQHRLIMTAPAMMDTLVVIVEGKGIRRDAINVRSTGVELGERASSLDVQGCTALLWPIESGSFEGQSLAKFVISCRLGHRIHSVVVLKGDIEHWQNTLATRSWDQLVEDGPLSPLGTATLRWIPAVSSSAEGYRVVTEEGQQRGGDR